MAKPFLILNEIDVRKAEQAGSGRSTTISKMVIPPLRLKSTVRSAGGGVMDVDYVQQRLQPIEIGLMINGFDDDFMPGQHDRWTFAASLRHRKTNEFVPFRCEVEGIVSDWQPDEMDPAQFNGCNTTFREVTHFEMSIDGKEWWYVDDEEREIRRMGVSLTAASRRAVGG